MSVEIKKDITTVQVEVPKTNVAVENAITQINVQTSQPLVTIASAGVSGRDGTSGTSGTFGNVLSSSLKISGSILPNVADGDLTSSFSLGSATNAWKDLWISKGTIYFIGDNNETASISVNADNQIQIQDINLTGSLTASLKEGYVWVGGPENVSIIIPTSSLGGGTGAGFPFVGIADITGSLNVSGSIFLNGVNIAGGGVGTNGTSGTSGVGSSGTSGNSGSSGTSSTGGSSGSSGTSGSAGTSATSGTSGIDGTSGVNGANGVNGADGNDGSSGTSGLNGTSGTTGTSGSSGTSSTAGSGGTSGISGSSGTSATSGSGGSSGTDGTAGSGGSSGTSGSGGTSGTDGTAGSGGTSGSSGSGGTSGSNGSSGTSGSGGTSGIRGEKYKTSSTTSFTLGSGGTLTVDTLLGYTTAQEIIIANSLSNYQISQITSYDPATGVMVFGAPLSVVGSGTFSSWIVNLSGASGGDGTSGTAGSGGSSGTSGSGGTSGTNGSTGSAGTSGSTGSAGSSGTSSTAGSGGTSGTSGSGGTSSTSGSGGTSGTSGSGGTSGTSGSGGSSGTSGSGGSSGTSGSSGSSGSSLILTQYSGSVAVTGSLTVSNAFINDSTLLLGNSSSLTLTSGSNLYIQQNGNLYLTGSQFVSGALNLTGSLIFNGVTYTTLSTGSAGGGSGTSGVNGTSGTSSTAGTSGTSATAGSGGSSGTSGSAGTSSTAGSGGTSGTSGISVLVDSGSFATTGSNVFSGSQYISGSIILTNGAIIKDNKNSSIAFGKQAAEYNQGNQSVAIGNGAGNYDQNNGAVAIGTNAGALNQGLRATAIGSMAGGINQGEYALALGNFAGGTDQAPYSIVINATGIQLNNNISSSLKIAPIRIDDSGSQNVLVYDTITNEVRYSINTFATTGSNTFNGQQTITGSLVLTDGIIANSFTGSILATNGVISSSQQITDLGFGAGGGDTTQLNNFTGSIRAEINGIEAYTASLKATTLISGAAQISALGFGAGGSDTSQLGISTASLNTFTGSVFRFYQTTASIHSTTASLNLLTASLGTFTASVFRLFQTTASIHSTTASLNTFTGSIRAEINGIEAYTASLKAIAIARTDASNVFLADQGVTGSLYVSSNLVVSSTLVNSANIVASSGSILQIQSGSSLEVTGSQYVSGSIIVTGSITLNGTTYTTLVGGTTDTTALNNFTGSIRADVDGIEAYTASLKSVNLISSSAQITALGFGAGSDTSQLGIATASLNTFTGSIRGEVNGIEAYTSSLKAVSLVSSSNQIPELFTNMQATASLNTFTGSIRGEIDGLEAYTASLKSVALVSGSLIESSSYSIVSDRAKLIDIYQSNTNVDAYPLFANVVGANGVTVLGDLDLKYNAFTNTLTVGNIFATTYGNGVISSSAQIGEIVRLQQSTASLNTFTGSVRAEIDGIEAYTSSLKATTLISGAAQISALGFGAGTTDTSQLGIATASLNFYSQSINLLTSSLGTFTASVNFTTRSLNLLTASLGTFTASINVATSSLNIFTGSIRGEVNGLEAYTASLKGAAIVSSSTQVQNYFVFAQTSSANTFYGNQTITGSLFVTSVGISDSTLLASASNLTLNSGSNLFINNGGFANVSGSIILTGSLNITGSVTITSGSVTMPHRPAFRVIGNASTDRVSSYTLSGSNFTVDYNQGSNFNVSNGRFTAPISGLYNIYYNGRVGSVNAFQQVIVYKNGVSGTVLLMWESGTNTGAAHFGVSTVAYLAAGDYISAVVAAGTIQFDGNDSFGATYIG